MIILACVLAVLVSVPLTGGRLGRLWDVRIVHPWAPVLAVLLQTVAVDGPIASMGAVPWVLHVVSYALAVWMLWANRHLSFLWLVAIGGLANLAAILLNGGVMPATPEAMDTAGLVHGTEFSNSVMSTGSPLWFLGDVFAIPAGWPLANVFSVGDIVLVVGLAVMLHTLARQPDPPHTEGSDAPVHPSSASPAPTPG